MSGDRPIVDEIGPADAYRLLETEPDTVLIDVRTRAEWAYVGMPDLSGLGRQVWPVEWTAFGAKDPNPGFLPELAARIGDRPAGRLLFICRSGVRSLAAARAAAAAGLATHCTNVAEGFEGDLDAAGHRGRRNGWKVHGLPWRQS